MEPTGPPSNYWASYVGFNYGSQAVIEEKGGIRYATRAFATPIFVASATPIFVASAAPYFRISATRTAATPKFFFNFSFV